MGSRIRYSKSASKRGEVRRRRRKRAERRVATAEERESLNARMREEGHPGWVANSTWWMRE